MDIVKGAEQICGLFTAGKPFFVGRNGTIETEVLHFWHLRRRNGLSTPYTGRLRQQLQRNAGIFPDSDESIDRWCAAYVDALEVMDGGAAGWYKPLVPMEISILDTYAAKNSFRTPLRSLEPYYVAPDKRWTQHLAGKHVCVVSSFAETMRSQVQREGIWDIIDYSATKWSFVKTGYAPATALGKATWPVGDTWEEAVKYVVDEVVAAGPDICLIGCGGLGMVIAGMLKRRGISVFVLGGAIQILFGIKGRRWETHDVISKFWNDKWVSPAASEVPGGAMGIEGGCYW